MHREVPATKIFILKPVILLLILIIDDCIMIIFITHNMRLPQY